MGFNSKVCCNTIVTVMYSTMVYTRYIALLSIRIRPEFVYSSEQC